MQLKVFKCLWGVAQIDEAAFSAYHRKGYDGIECKALNAVKYDGFSEWLTNFGFDFIAQIHSTGGNTVNEHLYSFEALINTSLSFNPVLINSQSGCDYWSLKEKCEFIEGALTIEEKYKVPVAHETHRSRLTYNPWDTATLIKTYPGMKVCCDFSHWVTVCERLLNTEEEQIQAAAKAAIHVHARVGYEQGPQVPDPRAPEFKKHVEAHETWWKKIWQEQEKKGISVTTICPEYGPPLYQQTIPYTQQPVSDVEAICYWALERLRKAFDTGFSNKGFAL